MTNRATILVVVAAFIACYDVTAADGKVRETKATLNRNGVPPRTLTLSGDSTCAPADTITITAVARDNRGNVVKPMLSWKSSNSQWAPIVSVPPDHQSARFLCASSGSVTVTATWSASTFATFTFRVTGTVAVTPPPPDTTPVPPGACPKLTDWDAHAEVALAKPTYLHSVLDPTFGTKITRITGDPGTAIGGGVSGNWPNVAKQNYPKDPAWTSNGGLLVLKEMSGVPTPGAALFLDGTTYAVQFSRSGPSGSGEWRLHPTRPDTAVYVNANGTVGIWNVRTNVSTTRIAAVAGYTNNEIGPSEGNLSYDGAYLVASATRTSDGHKVARVLNVNAGTVGVVIDLTAAGLVSGGLDWVSVSPLGGYVVAEGDFGLGRQDTRKIWNRSTGAFLTTWSDYLGQHFDMGADSSSNEVLFSATGQSPITKHWYARRLDNGTVSDRTPLGVTSYNWHVSNRDNLRLNWGLGVTNDRTNMPFDGEIYMLRLSGTQAVERWGKHRAINVAYNDAPHPVPSPDGRRIVFSSNWGTSGGPIQAYVLSCP